MVNIILNVWLQSIYYANLFSFSLDVFDFKGPAVDTFTCNGGANQAWIWNSTDGSQAVLLFKRVDSGGEPITIQWTDIGFSINQKVLVRYLWAQKDLGTFTGSYTSPDINSHSVMMLKITPK
jgi:hypothetical protein